MTHLNLCDNDIEAVGEERLGGVLTQFTVLVHHDLGEVSANTDSISIQVGKMESWEVSVGKYVTVMEMETVSTKVKMDLLQVLILQETNQFDTLLFTTGTPEVGGS